MDPSRKSGRRLTFKTGSIIRTALTLILASVLVTTGATPSWAVVNTSEAVFTVNGLGGVGARAKVTDVVVGAIHRTTYIDYYASPSDTTAEKYQVSFVEMADAADGSGRVKMSVYKKNAAGTYALLSSHIFAQGQRQTSFWEDNYPAMPPGGSELSRVDGQGAGSYRTFRVNSNGVETRWIDIVYENPGGTRVGERIKTTGAPAATATAINNAKGQIDAASTAWRTAFKTVVVEWLGAGLIGAVAFGPTPLGVASGVVAVVGAGNEYGIFWNEQEVRQNRVEDYIAPLTPNSTFNP